MWAALCDFKGPGYTHLAKAHLIGEDTVDALLVEVGQPAQALELVLFQIGTQHGGLLDGLDAFHVGVGQAEGVIKVTLGRLQPLRVRIRAERVQGGGVAVVSTVPCLGQRRRVGAGALRAPLAWPLPR